MPADAFLVLFSFSPMALVAGAVERQLAAVLRLAVVTELISRARTRGLQTKKARVTVRDINGQLRVPSVLQSIRALAVVKRTCWAGSLQSGQSQDGMVSKGMGTGTVPFCVHYFNIFLRLSS